MDVPFYQAVPAPSVEISETSRIASDLTVDPTQLEPSLQEWRFFYLDRMIFATHEVLDSLEAGEILPPTTAAQNTSAPPKLNVRQKETFFLSSLEGPKFTFHKTFAVPVLRKDCSGGGLLRFLEREPWADLRPDKVVCLGCGCDVSIQNPANWICHRDLCVGIDNAMSRSVVDAWEAEIAESGLIESC
ncbi:uncharacterized protein EV420DRAFT_1483207 [Desarmillaria tabescens]|uniref:Uncharacterized protein n=1 Tax=Armillaria tabescens TaxID=1929756 RepID=A0AA39JU76_ARMTA|nr:uncharacterized protein EV420DRAFT_1483207 [Desarmillaria tabescens]KAK0449005.1 hypothetical protein EV420DRAFT_1483207 [Desarmillaria tabescens]